MGQGNPRPPLGLLLWGPAPPGGLWGAAIPVPWALGCCLCAREGGQSRSGAGDRGKAVPAPAAWLGRVPTRLPCLRGFGKAPVGLPGPAPTPQSRREGERSPQPLPGARSPPPHAVTPLSCCPRSSPPCCFLPVVAGLSLPWLSAPRPGCPAAFANHTRASSSDRSVWNKFAFLLPLSLCLSAQIPLIVVCLHARCPLPARGVGPRFGRPAGDLGVGGAWQLSRGFIGSPSGGS